MTNINNISYSLDNGNGIEFNFTYKSEGFRQSYLQLPNTPDSIHTIDNDCFDSDNEDHSEIFEGLRDYFYSDFKDIECAKASAFTGSHIIHVQSVTYGFEWFDEYDDRRVSSREFYVAFSEDSSQVLKEGRASSYYNVFYFDVETDLSSDQETEIIKLAKKEFFAELETALKNALEKGTDAQSCDDIVNDFMNENFWHGYYQTDSETIAMDFYENIACDCRLGREHEI